MLNTDGRGCTEHVIPTFNIIFQVDMTKFKEIIITNACTCLLQPDLYQGQDVQAQLAELFFSEFFSSGKHVPSSCYVI